MGLSTEDCRVGLPFAKMPIIRAGKEGTEEGHESQLVALRASYVHNANLASLFAEMSSAERRRSVERSATSSRPLLRFVGYRCSSAARVASLSIHLPWLPESLASRRVLHSVRCGGQKPLQDRVTPLR